MTHHPLYNPVFNSLTSGDQHLGTGTPTAKYFFEDVSPFASFETGYQKGFEELYELLPSKRSILYATPVHITTPKNWRCLVSVEGVQMLHNNPSTTKINHTGIKPLSADHVNEMIALAELTKPGPFGKRTIEFGNYFGIFENGKLAAMAGQRMHIGNYTEISAVCTHPDALGKGFATILVQHQLNMLLEQGKQPFLHTRADNERAIKIYERLGFSIRSAMNFYFLKKMH